MAPTSPEIPAKDPQIQSYIKEGFLVVSDLISKENVNCIRDEAVKFGRGIYDASTFAADGKPPIPLEALPESATDDEALERILAVHNPHWVSSQIHSFIDHKNITEVLRRITAAHLPFWDGSIKCMQTMLFAKPPEFQGQAWHQDERYIPTRDRSLIGAWIALDDATKENGCLWVLPGSHQSGYLYPTHDHKKPEEFDWADESFGFEDSGEIAVEVKSGSVVFFNGYLLHRSKRNRSSRYRRALVNHYCNAYSLLPWGQDAKSRPIATYDNRMVVPVGKDPYEWKGYKDSPKSSFLRPRKAGIIRPTEKSKE